eukprot:TRINITY_DN55035_c0_g1_i1.p1 TRINITY_DN55035_c0_g1~~TRINITY_DN55035_c0_g1_i1.p1  ORF type:complete len:461 (+),score=34.79 TRINITY_DN55035_c0_g1_i1:53-1435(+)
MVVMEASPIYDLVVIGGGPAGLGAAARACSRDVKVCLVDPDPDKPWHCTYCTWLHELDGSWLEPLLQPGEDIFDVRWPHSKVVLDEKKEIRLGKGYGRLDRHVLRNAFLRTCKQAGMELVKGVAVGIKHYDGWSEAVLQDASVCRGRVILDASGHYTKLLERTDSTLGEPRCWQSFVGEVLRCREPHGYAVDTAIIFDWRDPFSLISSGGRSSNLQTFAYILPLDEHRIFVEETVLISPSRDSLEDIDNCLQQRKLLLGLSQAELEEPQERDAFPMGGNIPVLDQRGIGLGGSARMVHPCTGYCVAHTLRSIPAVIDDLIEGLATQNCPKSVALSFWANVWSEDKLRTSVIHSMGAEVLMKLDRASFGSFFCAFFDLSADMWMGFLDRTHTTKSLVFTFFKMFMRAPLRIKLLLARTGIGFAIRRPLVSAVFGGLFSGSGSAADSRRKRTSCLRPREPPV